MTTEIPLDIPLEDLSLLLGWLAAAVNTALVTDALKLRVPALAGGMLRLVDLKPRRLRLSGDHWRVLYELTVEDDAGPRLVRLSGELRSPGATPPAAEPDGWNVTLPELGLSLHPEPEDTDLPALEMLTDPERARAFLERSIGPARPGLRVAACEPEVLRYKPGSRCTVRYRLAYADADAGRDWPDLVIAKTYAADKGRNAWEGMRALWDSGLSSGEVVSLAEPLAYADDERVLLQGPVRGERTLKQLMRSALRDGTPEALAELDVLLERAAAGLAALHTSGVGHGEPVTWADEAARQRALLDDLSKLAPDAGQAATAVLDRLAARDAETPTDPPVPSHRGFRPAQVLVDDGRVGFIDFDSFCQGEPAMDVGLFRAAMRNIGMYTPLPDGDGDLETRIKQVEAACERFLATYEALAPVSRVRVGLWESLELLIYVINGWAKVQPSRLDNLVLALRSKLTAEGLVHGAR
jgi:phosphotransferase family enzyme